MHFLVYQSKADRKYVKRNFLGWTALNVESHPYQRTRSGPEKGPLSISPHHVPLKKFYHISFPQTCAHLLLQTFAPLMNQLPANSALHTAARNEQPIHITLKMATALYNSQHLTRLIPESRSPTLISSSINLRTKLKIFILSISM